MFLECLLLFQVPGLLIVQARAWSPLDMAAALEYCKLRIEWDGSENARAYLRLFTAISHTRQQTHHRTGIIIIPYARFDVLRFDDCIDLL